MSHYLKEKKISWEFIFANIFFTGINFCERKFYKDLVAINFAFAIRNIFSMTLVYGFENDLSKNYYFLPKQMTK